MPNIQHINKQKEEDRVPSFINSRSIKPLAKSNFVQVLGNKDTAAMVMFYNPDCIYCQSAGPHFMKAAKTTAAKNRLYAAVDCTKEEQLCELEGIKTFPTFKLYVGGRFLAKYNQTPNYVNMRNFVENAPLETYIDTTHHQSKDTTYISQTKKKFPDEM